MNQYKGLNQLSTKSIWRMRNLLFKKLSEQKQQLGKTLPSQRKVKALHRLNQLKDSFAVVVDNYSKLIQTNANSLYTKYDIKTD